MLTLIGWVLCGWIAGSIAQWFFPPSSPVPGWQTVSVGVAGSVVGGVVYSLLYGAGYSPAGVAFSVVGAVITLAAIRWYEANNGG